MRNGINISPDQSNAYRVRDVKKETGRVNKLRNYRILDSGREGDFDSITKLAAHICQAPISLITLVDLHRQWFKSTHGVDLQETPRAISFCTHTIAEDQDFMVIDDLTKDKRFTANPFVEGAPHVKFYAGVSMVSPSGERLGTVCVLDDKVRHLRAEQLDALKLLAKHAMSMIELKRNQSRLAYQQEETQSLNKDLEQFAYAIAHDIKSPLRNINSFATLLNRKLGADLGEQEQAYLSYISSSAKELAAYTQNLLSFTRSAQLDTDNSETINPSFLLRSINKLINADMKVDLIFPTDLPDIFTAVGGVQQILQNLISNGIRYRNKTRLDPYVKVEMNVEDAHYRFRVSDNGMGISQERMKDIFALFNKDDNQSESSGIGLNVVKRLVDKMNGQLSVTTRENDGTSIEFTIEKILK